MLVLDVAVAETIPLPMTGLLVPIPTIPDAPPPIDVLFPEFVLPPPVDSPPVPDPPDAGKPPELA